MNPSHNIGGLGSILDPCDARRNFILSVKTMLVSGSPKEMATPKGAAYIFFPDLAKALRSIGVIGGEIGFSGRMWLSGPIGTCGWRLNF